MKKTVLAPALSVFFWGFVAFDSPAIAQDVTSKMAGATVYYPANLHIWKDYYREDGVYLRTAYSVNGQRSDIQGTWHFKMVRGRMNLCYVLDNLAERCRWFFRKGKNFYAADHTLPSGNPMESIEFKK